MISCLENKIRRCRPFLGTFVEISAIHSDLERSNAVVDAAFEAMERVHRLMSFHDPTSELSQLNRWAVSRPVSVSMETYHVLECAQELYKCTQGVFDVTVAFELMQEGLLPQHPFLEKQSSENGNAGDIQLLPGRFVRFQRPLAIDLGGIAKGFAVDQAIEALRKGGAVDGFVNAGGDMRCFGEEKYEVQVRHPAMPGALLPLTVLKNAALATSANSYNHDDARSGCAHIHGRTRRPMARPFSVSVRASSCLIADALTKVVLALHEEAVPILAQFDAAAFIVYPDNRVMYFGAEETA